MTKNEKQTKVLVVDDEPFVLKLLVRQLSSLGFQDIVSCDSVREAMSVMEADAPSVGLIFSDLQMPEVDGVEFVRHLVHSGYRGALVLVSGEDQRILQTVEKLAKARSLNVLGALHKPVSPEQLKKLLDGKNFSLTATGAAAARAARKSYSPEELRHAIEAEHIINYYQPKVQVATGRFTGVETLVRWKHHEDGLVFPDQFIATAEEYNLIDDLTKVVLRKALRQSREWRNAGLETQIAVNVSMQNLTTLSMDFPDFVSALAAEAGVPAATLMLEVTESKLMSDPLASLDILTRLRLKGIGLSIDDFGTGHSSLAQLRDVPFSELKIDRGFVHGAWQDASIKAIFDASLGMARQLGIKTVAEGVEDRADWNYLRTVKCDLAQGYFIGRPMPAELLQDWIADWEYRDLAAATT